LVTQDDRPFALSTPNLGGNGHLYLQFPFNSPELDELCIFGPREDDQPVPD
jgi:hypothetical protein